MIRNNINLYIIFLVLGWCVYLSPVFAQTENEWPMWQSFQQKFISADGRVIDPYQGRDITTSEGQSYAMFFALVNNQPALFQRLLAWTEANLAKGDLSTTLPAWQWGKNEVGVWAVLDSNSASDADLWIIYSLIEASRLWHNAEYLILAKKMARLVLAKEAVNVPGLGVTLLPAQYGFHQQGKSVNLNPSYLPMQLLARFAVVFADKRWQQLKHSSYKLLIATSPYGYAPDWLTFDFNRGFDFSDASGSYDAIRVYLWAGMLAPDSHYFNKLSIHFSPWLDFIQQHHHTPLKVNAKTAETQGRGGVGFSAALLPLVSNTKQQQLIAYLQADITNQQVTTTNNYYDHVLTLFGQGWYHNKFRFLNDGKLQVALLNNE